MEGIFVLLGNDSKIKSRNELKFALHVGKERKGIFSKSDFSKNELISLKSKKQFAVILN